MGGGRDDTVMSCVWLITRPSLGSDDRGRRPADMMWRCHGVVITMMSQLDRSSPGSSPLRLSLVVMWRIGLSLLSQFLYLLSPTSSLPLASPSLLFPLSPPLSFSPSLPLSPPLSYLADLEDNRGSREIKAVLEGRS